MNKQLIVLCVLLPVALCFVTPIPSEVIPSKVPEQPLDSWTSCDSNSHYHISSISASPIKKGADFTLTVHGNLDENVSSGKFQSQIWIGILKVYDETFDLCDAMKSTPTVCPWAKGDFSFVQNFQIPQDSPNGNYKERITVRDTNDEVVMCVEGKFTL